MPLAMLPTAFPSVALSRNWGAHACNHFTQDIGRSSQKKNSQAILSRRRFCFFHLSKSPILHDVSMKHLGKAHSSITNSLPARKVKFHFFPLLRYILIPGAVHSILFMRLFVVSRDVKGTVAANGRSLMMSCDDYLCLEKHLSSCSCGD